VSETEADIVDEIKPGLFVWFAPSANQFGFREAWHVEPWTADPVKHAFNYDLAREWVTVTYTDGHVHDHVRYGTHEVWLSGDRPMIGES
jgi:hypothetical protein